MLPGERARRLIPLIDLTLLDDDTSTAKLERLTEDAVTPLGPVAAVCSWPRFAALLATRLHDSPIAACVVANFPAGTAPPDAVADEISAAVAAGVGEIDVVFPYRAALAGNWRPGEDLVRVARAACPAEVRLKVILESAAFGDDRAGLERAAAIALDEGADFLKTSTGKLAGGATPEAAAAIINVLAAGRARGLTAGFKVSGGVRRPDAAVAYLEQFERAFGTGSAVPGCFRIGASVLLSELRTALE